MLTQWVKALVPARARQYAREQHRRYVFRHAMRQFARLPAHAEPPLGLLADLDYGWGNDWSAKPEYLAASLQAAWRADGPILECGSGLSTMLLGSVAARKGSRVWSLEHHAGWGARTRQALADWELNNVEACIADLRDYGGYTWYDPPTSRMPTDFALVVCDGPPGETPGGRYGLLPIMRAHLKPGCVILLDDAIRAEERAIAARWAAETGASCTFAGTDKPYGILVLPSASGPG